jgi:hypothetical protein
MKGAKLVGKLVGDITGSKYPVYAYIIYRTVLCDMSSRERA